MRTHPSIALLLGCALALACAGSSSRNTLAGLHAVEPDLEEVRVEDSLEQAIAGYQRFLEETPRGSLTPEAMRRLADLKLEKEYGLLGDGAIQELPAPEPSALEAGDEADASPPASIADLSESQADFERRASGADTLGPAAREELELPGGGSAEPDGPLEAIALYDEILATYPGYVHNDQVLYQKSRALDELGRVDEAVLVMDQLIAEYPHSRRLDEVHFRRAEFFFTRRKYLDAEDSYLAIRRIGEDSEFYELALYKLGWTFYKQELHEEALDQYVALLDYKVSTGYDFDQTDDEADERRIADTYRVISLSFSNIGGPEAVADYFGAIGARTYEDRIYSHLGEFYLEKLRYHDAAMSYRTFVDLNPLHRVSPSFSMRVVEIYETGGFPKLVLESKKDFAATYGVESEYWRHFDLAEAPEVQSYLKSNLEDLAHHYHALYQEEELAEERPANFLEASRWYREYRASFPDDPKTPLVNHRLADLLLENRDFAQAAQEYERTAYDYAAHEKSSEAGYAAIFAHRERQKAASEDAVDGARQAAVGSTLRFVDVFPEHEHAAVVLGAAVDDLYDMGRFEQTVAVGHRLIESYPEADPEIVRSAWAAVGHAALDLADYVHAEASYSRVLEMTPAEDEGRQDVIDNLAAAIYKQAEQASAAEDHRTAADHFLRVARAAPTSKIRPLAEYDAGAALIQLEEWDEAARVLDGFREAHPDHELEREATKQIAFVQREAGNLTGAASEYERVAAEAEEPELRREALLVAGELYEDAEAEDRALAVYLDYVAQFPAPLDTAVETRSKIAEMYLARSDVAAHREQLRQIVAIDAAAGGARTPRTRFLAARSALRLAEDQFGHFAEARLLQPFEHSLQEKQKRMRRSLDAFEALVDYEVGEVTAASTFYIAEIYLDFSRALLQSERPTDLGDAEMQDYEMVLEEEAFPFEERAIAVHEKNLELMGAGVYNDWIEKSLAALAEMMPGRYAKFEESSGWIRSIDAYAYRAPGAPPMPAEDTVAGR